jgi:hypothetical protein
LNLRLSEKKSSILLDRVKSILLSYAYLPTSKSNSQITKRLNRTRVDKPGKPDKLE